jgi:hypothetical protein
MYSELRNKEFGIIDLIKSGWQIFQKNFFSIFVILLVISFPFNTLVSLAALANVSPVYIEFQLGGFLSLWLLIALQLITEHDVLDRKITAWSALKRAASRWPSALGASILFGFLIILRLLLIIPGIIYFVNTAFFLHAVGLRNQGWKAALDYSRNIVKGHFWKVFFTSFSIWLTVSFFPNLIFSYLVGVILGLIGQGSNLFLLHFIPACFADLTIFLNVIVGTVFFLNMDYRKSLEN